MFVRLAARYLLDFGFHILFKQASIFNGRHHLIIPGKEFIDSLHYTMFAKESKRCAIRMVIPGNVLIGKGKRDLPFYVVWMVRSFVYDNLEELTDNTIYMITKVLAYKGLFPLFMFR